jgi:hypothetical protein
MMKGWESNDVICKYCTLKDNNKSTSQDIDGEGQIMEGYDSTREEKGGAWGVQKGPKGIKLIYYKPKTSTSYYPK